MPTVISKASIQLSINSGAVDVGLKNAANSVKEFGKKAKENLDAAKNSTTNYAAESGQRLKGVGEQLGRVASATGSLASLDLSRPQTIFATLQQTISGVGSALETGANKAAIFKGALAATGIGLAVAGLSALFSMGTGDRETRRPESGSSDAMADEILDRLSPRRRITRVRFAGDVEDIGRAARTDEERATVRPTADLAADASAGTARLGREIAGLGLSSTAAEVAELRERLMAMDTSTREGAEGFRVAASRIEHFALAAERAEAGRLIGSLESLATGMRRSADTMGMSSEEAAIYAAGLVRVTETVDGVTRTVERSLSPHELLTRRTTELDAALRGGRISLEEWRTETGRAEAASRRHAAAIGEARSAARALEMGRARAGIEEFTESMQEAAANVGLADAERSLRRLEETLRRAGVPADEIAGRLDAARRSVDDLRAAEERLRAAEATTAAAVSLREADATPLERARAEIERIRDLSRRGAIDSALRDRSIGRILQTAAGRGAELRGPQLLEAGSVEAERVLRDFRRGPTTAEETAVEMLRRIEDQLQEERRQRVALERLARDFAGIGAGEF